MGLQFVRIFLFLSCHPRNLPCVPSSSCLAFSAMLLPKETQDSSVTLALVLKLNSLLLRLVVVLQLLSRSYLQIYPSSDLTNLFNAWQFLSFGLLLHFLSWVEYAFPVHLSFSCFPQRNSLKSSHLLLEMDS